MIKKGIIVICGVFAIIVVAIALALTGNKGDVSNVNHVIGYSELYSDTLINEACRVVEQKFTEEFEGCTLTELRYNIAIENMFSEEIEKYHREYNQELIVLLSTFNTDENGGDGSFIPNDTYTSWQWHLVRTPDKDSWEVISWGY